MPIEKKQLAAERLQKLNFESEKRKRFQKDEAHKTATSDSLLTSPDSASFQTTSRVTELSEKQKRNDRHGKVLSETLTECDRIGDAGGILDSSSFTRTSENESCTAGDGSSRMKKKERKKRKSKGHDSDETDLVTAVVSRDKLDTLAGKTIDNCLNADIDNDKTDQISHVSEELTLNKLIKNQKRKERNLNRKRLRGDGGAVEALHVSGESDVQSNTLIDNVQVLTDNVVNKGKKRKRSHPKGENESDDNDCISKRKMSADDKNSDGKNSVNNVQNLEKKDRLVTQKETKSMKRRRLRNSKVDSKLGKKTKIAKSKPGMAADRGTDGRSAVKEKDDDNEDDHSKQIGGFTVLKGIKTKTLDKIQRRLPDWLAKPSIVSADIQSNLMPLEEIRGLEPDIVIKLRENGIENFFPVQAQVIPALIDSVHFGAPFLVGKAGYRPRDICCSAPTGSGKTLAFVLPIVQALRSRVVCQVRALIVLPVQDLATQVYKVFLTYCEGTGLKVSLLTGQNTFVDEQKSLVRKSYCGYESLADITIATPGRLVDHINKTAGFDLRYLRFLVIDEADRMMDDIKQDWIQQLEAAVYCQDTVTGVSQASGGFIRHRPTALIAANATRPDIPLQKLLFSATLSHNPETLQRLSLFQPRLFTSVVQRQKTDDQQQQAALTRSGRPGDPLDDNDEYIGKFTTPSSLTELCVECTTSEKPLIVLYLLKRLKYRNVLCFTNTMEATHRLRLLLKFHGGIRVREFSSQLPLVRRSQILSDFKTGKIHIIICTDQMARGMDIENVRYVLSYDAPLFIKTYIHRVGRTARAGKPGTAVTLLEQTEMIKFRKLLSRAGKDAPELLDVTSKRLKSLVPGLTHALNRLPHAIKRESRLKKSQPKTMKLSENTG